MNNQTNENLTLNERIVRVQSELKAPKSLYNSFGKYRYRSCENILEAVKPLCTKYGLLLMLTDEVEVIAHRIYVKATATIMDAHNNYHSVEAYAREDEVKKGMDGSQITGTASSYARKYALNGLFCIDDTKDADATNDGTQTAQASNEYNERVLLAVQEVKAAQSRQTIVDVWNNNKDLQADARFSEAIKQASTKFPKA